MRTEMKWLASFLILLTFLTTLPSFGQRVAVPTQNPIRFITFSYATGGTNATDISITARDASNNTIANANFDFWLSDNASGTGISATAASTGIQIIGGGFISGPLTTSTSLQNRIAVNLTTDVTGTIKVRVTDTGKTTFVPTVRVVGSNRPMPGTRLTAGNYGFILWTEIIPTLTRIFQPDTRAVFTGKRLYFGGRSW